MSQLAQRLIMAAGGAKKETTYVDDVFSTYLYEGTGQSNAVLNGIKIGNANAGTSVDFDAASSDALITSHSNDFDFGSGDFTIEAWIKPTNAQQVDPSMVALWNFPDGRRSWGIFGNTGGSVITYNGSVRGVVSPDGQYATRTEIIGTLTINSWNHVAFIRNGNTLNFFINGVSQGTASYTGSVYNNASDGVMIGSMGDAADIRNKFDGNISNVRVVKGTALYTSNFTPPTAALKSVSNTKLLCCNGSTTTSTTVNTSGGMTALNTPTMSVGPFTATDGKGGMVWCKQRDGGNYILTDTVRGAGKGILSNSTDSSSNNLLELASFNNNGFSLGSNYQVNTDDAFYASWTWAINEGFFDVVTWTGNNTGGRTIPHNLGSVPGCIIVKNTSSNVDWAVWHRAAAELNATNTLKLNTNGAAATNNTYFDNGSTPPTKDNFTVHTSNRVNAVGETYVAYVYAGGESTAATARSVAFSSTGTNDGAKSLTIAGSSGTNFGSGDFTMECWFKDTRTNDHAGLDVIFSMSGYNNGYSGNSFTIYTYGGGFRFFDRTGGNYEPTLSTQGTNLFGQIGQWHHFAWTRSGSGSNNNTVWVDGNVHATFTNTRNYTDGQNFYIGANDYNNTGTPDQFGFNGKISNVRITKGQAIYTSAFKPSTEPLTTTTGGATASNVKIICCNNSSITGSSLTSGTISSTNTPTASIESPFDDPNGFKFGEEGDQNIIKCGSYGGNGSEAVDVNIGWEPSWVMIKNASTAENWFMFDNMRGVVTGGNDNRLQADETGEEFTTFDYIEFNPTGFKVNANATAGVNGSGNTMTYIALRRPDGYVGKPPEAGTDVFAMDTGNASSTIPNFDSGFPVGFAFMKTPASSGDWYTGARLLGEKYVRTNSANVEADWGGGFDWDSNVGWLKSSAVSGWQSWMWKRHAGFDVVCYEGLGFAGQQVPHNLSKVPEMMWVKRRDGANRDWQIYHKGSNGGTNPERYKLLLNTSAAETLSTTAWASTAPTSSHISLGHSSDVNGDGSNYIAMLFASVEGISKVGSYTGSSYDVTINLGFTPRFLMVKAYNTSSGNQRWTVFDSLRGMGAGSNDNRMYLDDTQAQQTGDYITSVSATGITMKTNFSYTNSNGYQYIYYAHA